MLYKVILTDVSRQAADVRPLQHCKISGWLDEALKRAPVNLNICLITRVIYACPDMDIKVMIESCEALLPNFLHKNVFVAFYFRLRGPRGIALLASCDNKSTTTRMSSQPLVAASDSVSLVCYRSDYTYASTGALYG